MAHTDSWVFQDTYAGKLLMMPEQTGDTCVLVDCMKMMFVARSSKDKCLKYGYLHLVGWLVLPIDKVVEFTTKLDPEEAKLLYTNTMQKAATGDHRAVCGALQRVCDKIPALQWTGNQLNVAIRNRIAESEARRAAAIAANPLPAPVPPPVRAGAVPATGTPGNPTGPARPKAGSTTGRVWVMCDTAHNAAGEVKDWKLFKKGIIVAGIVEGINESTVSVQFGKWKLASGF